jgi:hypothetical protein
MGAPIAGRGTEKDSGFDARASQTALSSWKARFQFPLPAHRLRGGLFCLCGERLGEGNCYHLMQRERTHFPDEPNFLLIREVGAQFFSCLTNAASAPSPNLSPRPVAEHGITHRGERDCKRQRFRSKSVPDRAA